MSSPAARISALELELSRANASLKQAEESAAKTKLELSEKLVVAVNNSNHWRQQTLALHREKEEENSLSPSGKGLWGSFLSYRENTGLISPYRKTSREHGLAGRQPDTLIRRRGNFLIDEEPVADNLAELFQQVKNLTSIATQIACSQAEASQEDKQEIFQNQELMSCHYRLAYKAMCVQLEPPKRSGERRYWKFCGFLVNRMEERSTSYKRAEVPV
eukprot:gb/GEZN01017029.1/.p1 GENE.gb/GEZN01017029.1/~~gb/GEZN01017029.1/.p1  ORF type:complete len:217 (+),score=27.10 gb/GEZN01017029.1/:77-727(+)